MVGIGCGKDKKDKLPFLIFVAKYNDALAIRELLTANPLRLKGWITIFESLFSLLAFFLLLKKC
jgi:hypothetical protein